MHQGETALIFAAGMGLTTIVDTLIKAGADVNSQAEDVSNYAAMCMRADLRGQGSDR